MNPRRTGPVGNCRIGDTVRLMLDRGAEAQPAKGQPAMFGATPLFFAIWSGKEDTDTGITNLGWSVFKNLAEQIRMLLAQTAGVNHIHKLG